MNNPPPRRGDDDVSGDMIVNKAYQQTEGYIPRTDGGFRDWLNNFTTLIAADPGRYGLTSADADVISNQNTAYEGAYVPVQSAETRTPALVQQKDAIKASAVGTCRVYAMIIKSNAGVTNQDKSALGIHINDSTRTPIPTPASSPLLTIQGAFSGEHVIRYADENTPASRRKPAGAIQIQINRHIAVSVNPDPTGSDLVGLFTKQPVLATSAPADVGKTATYFGRWVTRTGLFGPWGLPVAMTIAFGGAVEQLAIPDGGLEPGQPLQLKKAA